ncbi:unnamed protein product, partial [Laminaria digitata]
AAPLLPSLRSQWATAAAAAAVHSMGGGGGGGDGGGGSSLRTAENGESSTEKEGGVEQQQQHQHRLQRCDSSSATHPQRQPRQRQRYHHHQHRQHRQHHCSSCPPVLTLVAVPSARAPLPPLCCGVCGSSWEIDSFGKGFRVYHIAVATNASLVWYLRRRFSEFLELHAALLSGGGGRGEAGR